MNILTENNCSNASTAFPPVWFKKIGELHESTKTFYYGSAPIRALIMNTLLKQAQ